MVVALGVSDAGSPAASEREARQQSGRASSLREGEGGAENPRHSRTNLASPTGVDSNRIAAWLRGMDVLRQALAA